VRRYDIDALLALWPGARTPIMRIPALGILFLLSCGKEHANSEQNAKPLAPKVAAEAKERKMPTNVPPLPEVVLPQAVSDPGWPPSVDYSKKLKIDVTDYIIDWSWEDATAEEREVILRWAARIQSSGFGIDLSWGAELLRAASAQVSKPIRALMEDENGAINIVEATNGKVKIRWSVPASDPVAKLLADADAAELLPVAINAELFAAAGIEKVEVAHYFPEWMLDQIRAAAAKADRSWSATVQAAWISAGPSVHADPENAGKALRAAAPESTSGIPSRRKQTLIFPTTMFAEIEAVAAAQDRSRSWIVNAAWALFKAKSSS
jgi:uncharacterized small protein (TIGR04563 family)